MVNPNAAFSKIENVNLTKNKSIALIKICNNGTDTYFKTGTWLSFIIPQYLL